MFKTLIDRWNSDSPKLFKYITNTCVSLGIIGTGIVSNSSSFPDIIVKIGGYLISASIVGGIISKLTTKE